MATLNIIPPTAGTQNVITINEEITSLDLNFDSSQALFERADNNLLITFEDGSSTLLQNFYDVYNADFMPEFVLDGYGVAGEDFFAALDENLMPASGNSASSGSPASEGAEQGSLESVTDTDGTGANTNSTGSLGSEAGDAGTFASSGISSNLGFQARTTNFSLENPANQPAPFEGDLSGFYSVSEGQYDLDKSGDENAVYIDLPEQYSNGDDVKIDSNGNVTVSAELAGYIDSLAPGQTVYINVPTENNGTLQIKATGSNINDDHIDLNGGNFTGNGTVMENVHPDHADVNDPTFKLQGNTLDLGAGNDSLTGGHVTKGSIEGGEGDDSFSIVGLAGASINGGEGSDTFNASWYVNTNGVVDGGAGDDTLTTKYLHNNGQVLGGEGDDNLNVAGRLYGGTVDGGVGNDTITVFEATGTQGDGAIINGGLGDDTINITNSLSDSKTRINGDEGNDTINVTWFGKTATDAIVDGGIGSDTINVGSMYEGTVQGGEGDDVINLTKTMIAGTIDGGEGNDTIFVASLNGTATVEGGAGDDTITIDVINSKDATVDGGEGHDIFVYDSPYSHLANSEITLTESGTIEINGNEFENITNFEGIGGGAGNDTLTGNSGDNTLVGGEGADILLGGAGSDLLVGGEGDDTFAFNEADFTDGANDVIEDFGNGSDLLDLSAFKSAGYDITFSSDGSDGLFTISNGELSQTITLQDISADVASQITDQLESASFEGGIKIM